MQHVSEPNPSMETSDRNKYRIAIQETNDLMNRNRDSIHLVRFHTRRIAIISNYWEYHFELLCQFNFVFGVLPSNTGLLFLFM